MYHNFYKPPPSLDYSQLVVVTGAARLKDDCLTIKVRYSVNKHNNRRPNLWAFGW